MTNDKTRRARLRTQVCAAALLGSLACATSASAQAVVVRGNQRVDVETIRSYITNSGDPAVARRDLEATGLFASVSVARQGAQTVVTVRENNLVNRVVFQGNSKLKSDVLAGEVSVKPRGPYSQTALDADIARIREVYRRAGRGEAKVTARTVDLPNGRVDVVYDIDEGSKTGVKEIKFEGNRAYGDSRLRGLMTTTESNLLSFIKTSDVYDADRIASDLELVRRYYLKNGYADFRVLSSDAVFDAARGGYVVTVVVEEGEPYKIGNVTVDSRIPDIDSTRLRSRVTTNVGATYDAEAVERSVQGVTNEAGSRGYAFAQVRPVGSKDPATRTVSLTYVVEEGPRVYIERINIRGNSRTRDYVIRRELELGEGDAYNRVLVDRGERRLNNLGYFKRVRVTNEPGSTPDRVVVNIDVEDQPTGAFSIAGGYSTADGIIGEVSVAESNFLGRGQFVRVAGQLGQNAQGIDFSFTEPYFLGYRLAAGFDLYSKYTDNTRYSRYENRVTGGQLRLGLPLTEELTFTARYQLYDSEIKIPNNASRPYNDCLVPIAGVTDIVANGQINQCLNNGEASVAIKEARGSTITSAPGYTLTYNSLDNIRDPRSGFAAELRQDIAGLGGDSQYLRTTGEVRGYYELFEDIVGLAKVQGGKIFGFGDQPLRIVDNFFMGPGLVRGFAPSGFGPRDMNGDFRNNAIGGTTYFGTTLEVQFPIFGLPRELGIKGAVFADAGTLFGYEGRRRFELGGVPGQFPCSDGGGGSKGTPTLPTINNAGLIATQSSCINLRDSDTIRSSVGASILWASPLGPIRFDYAIATSQDKYDRTQAFRFSGGTRF